MKSTSTTRPDSSRRQRGFSILAAVFILVVLAGLAGFIVSTSSTQHLSQALDAMNSRAQQAARAGIDWGVYQVVKAPTGNFVSATAAPPGCNSGSGYAADPASAVISQTLTGLPGLVDFTVAVACDSQEFQEGGDPAYRVYQITATACNAAACPSATPGFGYVEHQQRTRVKMP